MSGETDATAPRANLEVFADTVEELARSDPSLLVVTSDSRGSAKLAGFAARMPERMIEVGIAEQNLVGVAAGLAAGGRRVMAVSPASFLATRSLEQIKHDVCYSDRPVVLVGVSAGVSYGALGSTHHSLHDFGALRGIHNITVVAPADNWETSEALRAALAAGSPVYLRFGKKPVPDLPLRREFSLGKGRIVREGGDGAFIATGETVWRALAAAQDLAQTGMSTAVVSMHTVKPLDAALVRELGRSAGAVVVVEEHSEHGGLGDACARVLLEAGLAPSYRVAGIPDEYTVTGSQEEILGHYGISGSGLSRVMRKLLGEG
jgi:transketolase